MAQEARITPWIRCVLLAAASWIAACDRGWCEDAFSGETAAYIDWSVKSCEVKGSDKMRKLVEEAKAKAEDAFTRQYMKGFGAKELTDANADRQQTEKLCTKMKEWYGRSGTRIAGLITLPVDPPASTASKRDPSSDSKGGRRKRAPQ